MSGRYVWGEMSLATDDLEPGRLAAAINDLLIRHGYPPDKTSSWWTHWGYEALGGRTPAQAWNDHEYQKVYETIRDAYAASEEASRRLDNDPEHQALMHKRIQEQRERYGF